MIKKLILYTLFVSILLITNFNMVTGNDFEEDYPIKEVISIETTTNKSVAPPKIEAGAAIVLDTISGRVLYEKNAHSRKAIASTTKIMTAIVAIEKGDLEDKVKVSKKAASIWGSTINLQTGEELTLNELLYGMLIKSGNDAAIAVAEHIGGSVEGFVDMMNKKAMDLGLKDTSFKNPHGLDANGHYSTAYELAILTRYALDNPVFSKIVATQSTYIANRNLHTTNEMLGMYHGADGVKTGYTGKAGRCLVTSATRDNWRIVSVVLNCSSRTTRAQSSKSILDYAFYNYKIYDLLKSGETIGNIKVYKGQKDSVVATAMEDIIIPLTLLEKERLEKKIELREIINAPVFENVEVGKVKFYIDGELIAQSGITTRENIGVKTFSDHFNFVIDIWYKLMRH
ncbi:UNVERIFIED_CONTAM: D-alanyl-D-alanine carboxypeptidase (penicillin-binding protein 5/6) [Acetivibrio alkalicellulosi]